MSNHSGRSYTYCTAPKVIGTYMRNGHRIPTNTFIVSTIDYYDGAGRPNVYDIVTAYPVSPNY